MDDATLVSFLGCAEATRVRLALSRIPRTMEETQHLADRFGIEVERLQESLASER
jgi:hypothetical protein